MADHFTQTPGNELFRLLADEAPPDTLRAEIFAELGRRLRTPPEPEAHQRRMQQLRQAVQAPRSAAVPLELLARWHQALVKRYHPDKGGTVEAMKVINDAWDLLKEMLHAA